MTQKMQKARVADVAIGPVTVKGLMLPDSTFAIAATQVNDCLHLSVTQNYAAQALKRLMGKGFQTHKVKSELNPKGVQVITIDQFMEVVKAAAKSGNSDAIDFAISLAGLSLHQLWSDAFGVKFEAIDRQEWLKTRISGKQTRRDITDAIQDYIKRHPEMSEAKRRWMYKNFTEKVNMLLFGVTTKQLRSSRGIGGNVSTRDCLQEKEVKHIAVIEDLAVRLIDRQNMDPVTAAHQAIADMQLLLEYREPRIGGLPVTPGPSPQTPTVPPFPRRSR